MMLIARPAIDGLGGEVGMIIQIMLCKLFYEYVTGIYYLWS